MICLFYFSHSRKKAKHEKTTNSIILNPAFVCLPVCCLTFLLSEGEELNWQDLTTETAGMQKWDCWVDSRGKLLDTETDTETNTEA